MRTIPTKYFVLLLRRTIHAKYFVLLLRHAIFAEYFVQLLRRTIFTKYFVQLFSSTILAIRSTTRSICTSLTYNHTILLVLTTGLPLMNFVRKAPFATTCVHGRIKRNTEKPCTETAPDKLLSTHPLKVYLNIH